MATCRICGKTSELVSSPLRVCGGCIRSEPEAALEHAKKAHERARAAFRLPPEPPRAKKGVKCGMCANECIIPEGGKGYCGLRINRDSSLVDLARESGIVECYHDPLPTNCVAAFCCPGCTGAGYPGYSHSPHGPEYGYKNLAVFYGSCTFDCLFCQNWRYREMTRRLSPRMTPEELAGYVDDRTSCICYFGGDPSSQAAHAIKTSKLALERAEDILRICFESNGNFAQWALKRVAALSLESGGSIKFDLKAWDENLNIALCGVSNKAPFKNFKRLAAYLDKRRTPPLLAASTLLIPGYVDAEEVDRIAEYIAGLSPDIPYILLAFHPRYKMRDLPTTSWETARKCLEAAEKHLSNVRLGNVHLLS